MKKFVLLLSAFALTLIYSCAKETTPEIPGENETPLKITARLVEATSLVKTAYDESKTNPKFSWLQTDMIDIQLGQVGNPNVHSHWTFTADSNGATTTFSKVEGSTAGFELGSYAFYPKHADSSTGCDLHYNIESYYEDVTISEESLVSTEDLTSLVPLIGIRNNGTEVNEFENVVYDFKTLTGVLRVEFKNVPATAKAIRITAADQSYHLNGTVSVSAIVDGELSMSELLWDQSNTRTFRFDFSPTAGQTIIAYIPIPTGTLTGGFTAELLGAEDSQIIGRSIDEDILIERNNIYFLPEIDLGTEWQSIGTGWFGDNYLQASLGIIGRMAPVDIQQNKTNSNMYRIRDPYGSAASYLGVSLSKFHNSYLTFTLNGEGGVSFEDHKTGITWSDLNIMISDNSSSHNIVKYDAGSPKYIQLAPMYWKETSINSKEYTSAHSNRSGYTNIINIVFPGYSIGEAYSGEWAITGNTKFIITTESVNGNNDYNIKITRYQNTNVNPAIDISGTCYGKYDPLLGTITFATLQEFADTGTTQQSGTYAGSRIVYSFRGKLNGATQDLVFSVQDYNARLITTSDTFCLDKYIVNYGSASGYMNFQSFSGTPIFTKQ